MRTPYWASVTFPTTCCSWSCPKSVATIWAGLWLDGVKMESPPNTCGPCWMMPGHSAVSISFVVADVARLSSSTISWVLVRLWVCTNPTDRIFLSSLPSRFCFPILSTSFKNITQTNSMLSYCYSVEISIDLTNFGRRPEAFSRWHEYNIFFVQFKVLF